MALAVTQAVKVEIGTGTTATLNSAMTLSAGSLAVAGVIIWTGTAGLITASDSVNGAYTGRLDRDNGNPGCRILDRENVGAGLVNITVTCSDANGIAGFFHEATGIATSGAFDVQNGAIGTSTAPDTAAATNTVANAIYFALVTNAGGGNPTAYTINASGSEGTWLEKDATQSKELNANSFPVGGMVYQIVSSITARSHTWTMENVAWAAASAVYKGVPPTQQSGFRFRNDDGSETTATWKAAQDVAATITPDQTFRLRAQVDTSAASLSRRFKLQVRKVGDASWRDIDTTG